MASLTVTVGPCQVVFEDRTPFLTRRRVESWRDVAAGLLPDPDMTVVELNSAVERLVEEGFVDEDDVEDSAPSPSIGFRSRLVKHA